MIFWIIVTIFIAIFLSFLIFMPKDSEIAINCNELFDYLNK